MTAEQLRLDRVRFAPRILKLWTELQGLKSPLQFMMSGAHPDDENAPLLAALYFRNGINLSYVCATRGEGGQNNLGTERGAHLGALRTAEMEAACDILNMRLYWLSQNQKDPISDWRFSKSGSETLKVWGHDRTLARFVDVLRRDRPDMLCPTFLDVPGQHGHHRAMTQLAHEAFAAAADPAYRGSDLPVWSVSKMYLPAESGASRAYDDDLPPPDKTVSVNGAGTDPVTGWRYCVIGAMSHGHHRSQGMGYWPEAGRNIPLHLCESRVGSDKGAITDNLPYSLSDLGLSKVQDLCGEMIANFADSTKVSDLAREAFGALSSTKVPKDQSHRIDRKRLQLARIIALTSDMELADIQAADVWLRTGQQTTLTPAAPLALPEGWSQDKGQIVPDAQAVPYDGYRDHYDPLQPPLPAVFATDPATGASSLWPLDRPIMASPSHCVRMAPHHVMLNLATGATSAKVRIVEQYPQNGQVELATPSGWTVTQARDTLTVTVPNDIDEGHHVLPATIDGKPAFEVHQVDYPHIRPTQFIKPACLTVSVLSVNLPKHAVGYIGAGLDNVPQRLTELGVNVVDLSHCGPTVEALRQVSSLVIGIHAMRFNETLGPKRNALHDWVRAGGRLLTLYHRPWDNWNPDETPPLHLEIGQPSLRWRVTNKTAQVEFLDPEHPLLSLPNKITQGDFNGWDKERGLYFAKSWDADYKPLFSMADPDERPLEGGLLVANIGKGRHIHCALNLHHQLENMVPGAIRLMVNLL